MRIVLSDALELEVLPVTPFQQNCSLLRCRASGRGALIDPGGEPERLVAALEAFRVEPEKILLTHGHIDHAGATAELAERLGVPIEGPEESERYWIERLPEQGAMFGLEAGRAFEPDRWLARGDRVRVGALELEVEHCPGHTPGHVVFFHRPSRFAWVGDVLFQGSIGRTDFPLATTPRSCVRSTSASCPWAMTCVSCLATARSRPWARSAPRIPTWSPRLVPDPPRC